MADYPPLIRGLLQPTAYCHAVGAIEVVETHISWVLLTGELAYKIKKPVNLDFVDFSTLALRHEACDTELRLNRRFAPGIYLDVVKICGSASHPTMEGTGAAIEYAVKMVQFPAEARLDRVLARGDFGTADCDKLAAKITEVHANARVAAEDSPFGTAAVVGKYFGDALATALDQTRGGPLEGLVAGLQDWAQQELARLRPAIVERKTAGRVRECHGDLHSENIAVLLGEPVPFDCLEFREDLRWIDCMSDVGFIGMDLASRGHPRLAHRLLNAYVEQTGDVAGLGVLRFFQAYRAVVRGMVTGMQNPASGPTGGQVSDRARIYFELADQYSRPSRPRLVITHGVSGTGKTTATQELLEATGAVRLRSDVERRRGGEGTNRFVADHRTTAERYTPEARQAVYDRLLRQADTGLAAGFSIIVDATFLRRSQRDAFGQLAQRRGVPWVILAFDADLATLRQRIESRRRAGDDASEATLDVLERQIAEQEPIADDEREHVIAVCDGSVRQVIERLLNIRA